MNVPKSLLLFLAFSLTSQAWSQDNLTCLPKKQTLYAQLQQHIYAALDQRLEKFESLKSTEDIRKHQATLREYFLQQLGEFPTKCPLNSQTVRTTQADGYRIECVIFDSRPNHRVTANFYIPDGQGPFPGVVVASGHSRTAKTADYNQRFGIAMATNGMAALCFDPIGQGERSQIIGDDGKNLLSGTTTEHLLIGVGSILVGRNTASYEIWDSMRAVDYLVSRKEVDPNKIGITGCSGGGTQTSYTMALDDRIQCAAPACYLTTFRRLIETIGPQDSEQNIFGQLAAGLDQPDYVLLRAPKPTLISSTTQDFFDIRGSWENYRQAKRIFGRLGFPERVDLVEIEGKHGVKPQNLATIVHWMQRWLNNEDKPVVAKEIQHREASVLLCTESGQVLTDVDEKSVFDLNAEHAQKLAVSRNRLRKGMSDQDFRTQLAKKIGLTKQPTKQDVSSTSVGKTKREGYAIEKFVIRVEGRLPIPALVFHPETQSDATDVCLYVHTKGKAADAGSGGKIESLVKSGVTVVAVDLPGQGETATAPRTEKHGDWKTYYLAYLLGKSLVGIRTDSTIAAAHFANNLANNKPVQLLASGEAGIIALHAAALRPNLFATLDLQSTPSDWTSSVKEQLPSIGLDYTVHGALELYDLPDLKAMYNARSKEP